MTEIATRDDLTTLARAVGAPANVVPFSEGNAWTLHRDGAPVLVTGVVEMWPGMGQVWTLSNHAAVQGHGVWLTRQMRTLLAKVSWDKGFRQMRCMCLTPYDIRWCELVGWEMEGVWRDAGPQGQSVFIMVYHRRQ